MLGTDRDAPTNEDQYDPLDLLAEKALDQVHDTEGLGDFLRAAGAKALGREPNADEEDDSYWKARTEALEDILKRMIIVGRKGLPSKSHPSKIVVTVTPDLE